MTYEYYLKRPSSNFSWRPSFIKNMTNFTNKIENYRKRYVKAPEGSANERKIVANFNNAYSAWLVKVKNENAKRRAKENAFFKNLTNARRSGNAGAIAKVMAKYEKGVVSPRAALVARRTPVAHSASPQRSGKKRNTGNLRKMMAHRNLSRMKANLMTQKAALESERNKLETKIFAIIRKLGDLPY